MRYGMAALLILTAVAPPAIFVALGLAQAHPLLAALPLVWCGGFIVLARRFQIGMPVAELLVGLAIVVAVVTLLGP